MIGTIAVFGGAACDDAAEDPTPIDETTAAWARATAATRPDPAADVAVAALAAGAGQAQIVTN